MKRLFQILFLLLFLFPIWAQGPQESLNIAMDNLEPVVLNPYVTTDSNSIIILQNLYDGLFSYNGLTSDPEMAIALSYEVSPDSLVWTFKLKDAFFSDGSPITASTFRSSWLYLLQGSLASNLDFLAEPYEDSIVAVDDKTLVLKLAYPVPYLPTLLCQPCLAAIKDSNSYSGAYCLKEQSQDKISLEANPKYWDSVEIPNIQILLGSDFDEAFSQGKIHWSLYPINNAGEHMIISRLYATSFFFFSANKEPYSNPIVRTALCSVIPWDTIRYIQDTLSPSSSLVPDSGAAAVVPDNVLELLEKSGYPGGELKIGVHRGSQISLAAELIADIWSKTFGLTVTLDTVPLSLYASDPTTNPYDFCAITWIGDYFDPMTFLGLFESSASYNLGNFSEEEFDHLLEKADTSNQTLRASLLLEAEQWLLDGFEVIPTATAYATNFVRKDLISGWETNPLDIHPFKDLQFKTN